MSEFTPGLPIEEHPVWNELEPTPLDEFYAQVIDVSEDLANTPQLDHALIGAYAQILPRAIGSMTQAEFDRLPENVISTVNGAVNAGRLYLQSLPPIDKDGAWKNLDAELSSKAAYMNMSSFDRTCLFLNRVWIEIQKGVKEDSYSDGTSPHDAQLRGVVRQFGRAYPGVMYSWFSTHPNAIQDPVGGNVRSFALTVAEQNIIAIQLSAS